MEITADCGIAVEPLWHKAFMAVQPYLKWLLYRWKSCRTGGEPYFGYNERVCYC